MGLHTMNIPERMSTPETVGCSSRVVPTCLPRHRFIATLPRINRNARSLLRTCVYTPTRSEGQNALKLEAQVVPPANLLGEILAPVKADMELMNHNLKNVVGNRHPMLMAAAEQIFGAGGKKLRPVIVFLVAHSTAQREGLT